MPEWDPNKYLLFKDERTQPSIDLVEKINLVNPKNIIDIGCGPGNSTQILVNKWPKSNVTGLDSSKTMIERAKGDYPKQTWICCDANDITTAQKYELVFSNAALQWMDSHELLIPKLWEIVKSNGVFAVQIPKFETMDISIAIKKVLQKNKWAKCLDNTNNIKSYHELDYYYELLCKLTDELVLWETHYFHILPSAQSIIDFIQTTALKPYLEMLSTENEKIELKNEILEASKKFYKIQLNGKILFPFKRMFFIAYKN